VEQVIADVELVEIQWYNEGGECRGKKGCAKEGEREVGTGRSWDNGVSSRPRDDCVAKLWPVTYR
jgi:hypothetical protein